ncbi:MAG: DUF2058 domain-containing protein [Methylococcales bacterium]|nr:DUF2058 domain-containing protein [Methylococcales bacterium]
MAISLQEQLLKAGLSTQTKAKTLKTNKRKQVNAQRKNKVTVSNDTKAVLEQAKRQQAETDRQLNQAKQQQAEKKAISAQIKQLIELNKVPHDKDGEAYNFSDQAKVKKIYVSPDVRTQISEGRLAIVKIQQRYEIVPAEIALKIRQRDDACVLLLNDCMGATDETDLYANYQIPDDLMW